MTQALVPVPSQRAAVAPIYSTHDDLWQLSQGFAKARIAKSPEIALAKSIRGMSLGLDPVQSQATLYAFESNGEVRIGMWSKDMVAFVRRAGAKLTLTNDPTNPKTEDRSFAEWTGPDGVTATYTRAEAESAGLWGRWSGKGPIIPEQMLIWRAASRLIERELSHLIGGMPTGEFLEDVPEPLEGKVVPTSPDAMEAHLQDASRPDPEACPPEEDGMTEEAHLAAVMEFESRVEALTQACEGDADLVEEALAVLGIDDPKTADTWPRDLLEQRTTRLSGAIKHAPLVSQLRGLEFDARELDVDPDVGVPKPWRTGKSKLARAIEVLEGRVKEAQG